MKYDAEFGKYRRRSVQKCAQKAGSYVLKPKATSFGWGGGGAAKRIYTESKWMTIKVKSGVTKMFLQCSSFTCCLHIF